MADLKLAGVLNLTGMLNLTGDKILVNNVEALVAVQANGPTNHGTATMPVLIPPPPAAPTDPGLNVWIFQSFNATVSANNKLIVTQGMHFQGTIGMAAWPGMVQPSTINATITINNIPINVVGDMGITLPSGGTAIYSTSGQ